MDAFQKTNRLIGAAVFFVAFVVYFISAAPTVTFWDCGEFIATAFSLGVPHPPGAPTYTLLGRVLSIIPIGAEVAFRVNMVSVISAAATVLLIHLCVVRLLCAWLDPRDLAHRLALLTGGSVAALTTAFSTSFWANATEAEVYALSMCFTLLAFWLALRWDDAHKGRDSDRPLLAIAFLFGLGAGVHLQCLLTVPAILILVFTDLMEDHSVHRRRQILVIVALTLYPILAILLSVWISALMTLAVLVGLLVLRPAWRNPWFWIWSALLAVLGFSTYGALVIRSGLDPFIDMNNPESWDNFKAFLGRQQYGTHRLFPRRGDFWSYQLNIHIKYFLQQFPFYDVFTATFRRAVATYSTNIERVSFSLIPIMLGIGGAIYHMRKNWSRFAAVFSMFLLMGLGLVIYLNMPDPEPREREYIFVGAYTVWGFWVGMGAAGVVVSVARDRSSLWVPAVVAGALLFLPTGMLQLNYFSHNKSRDRIAHDYGHNILESCDPGAILFTNGDNDTYPLWFLQNVKGIRTDVQVVNLSLLKTPWYIKQIRDQEPGVPLGLTDRQVEQEALARPWRDPKDMEIAGLAIPAEDIPTTEYRVGSTGQSVPVLETQSLMIWYIVQANNWSRPIYFAVTVPTGNMAGLRPYLSMEGMAYRLVRQRGSGQFNIERTASGLFGRYRFEGVADRQVYKDPVARRLLGNYLVLFDGLTRAHLQNQSPGKALEVLQRAEELIPPHALDSPLTWASLASRYREVMRLYHEAGQTDSAVLCLEELVRVDPGVEDRDRIDTIIRSWKAQIDSAK
ncbi:MAG: DUF2723 domain-containing protein [Candidatus Latescibacteria bacterium]|jgi:hypothetical protein|nr:DUF2723 domain-containing protein [Candidatus Latescibacterota bacterium]